MLIVVVVLMVVVAVVVLTSCVHDDVSMQEIHRIKIIKEFHSHK